MVVFFADSFGEALTFIELYVIGGLGGGLSLEFFHERLIKVVFGAGGVIKLKLNTRGGGDFLGDEHVFSVEK